VNSAGRDTSWEKLVNFLTPSIEEKEPEIVPSIEENISDSLYDSLGLEQYETIENFSDRSQEADLYVLDPLKNYRNDNFEEASDLLRGSDVLVGQNDFPGVAYYATQNESYDFKGPRDIQTATGEISNHNAKYFLVSVPEEKHFYSK